ncbi:MAG: efflux RND transporter periplasmic adaptor subunit [Xanthobacteraceae bacterium]|nr:efflux RND transporter periplasmic adaptor subunit [Xanthobacteraceae bacterium]
MVTLQRYRIVIAALGWVGLAVTQVPSLKTARAEEAFDRKMWVAVAPGRVEPWSGEIRIGSAAMGRVGDVLVKANDTVFAGEALVRLDDEEVRNRHAKAELQYTFRKRARSTASGKAAERRKHEDAVADAESAVVTARAAVDRASAAKRSRSGDDLAVARKNLANAQEQLRDRRVELAKFDVDATGTAAGDPEGLFATARLDLRAAEAAVENLIVRAPIDGTVLQINVRPGELASPSAQQPLVVIGDVSKLRVRAEIDERDYGDIKAGQRVVVRSPAFRGRDVAGTVSSVAPIIEPGRIGARGQRSPTDVSVAEVVIDLAEPGPLAVGMKVDVYFSRDGAK